MMQGYFGEVDCDYTCCTGECGDDYCRCSKIINAKITSLDALSIAKKLIPKKDLDTLKGYCKERVLRHCGVFDLDNWEPNIQQGYYGEQCDGISLNNTVLSKVKELLKTGLTIPKVLTLEYGYLLENLKNCKWNIAVVPRESIIIGQNNYYSNKLNPKIVDSYKDHTFPICVCIHMPESGNGHILIDGYHRFAATDGKRKIKIILGSK